MRLASKPFYPPALIFKASDSPAGFSSLKLRGALLPNPMPRSQTLPLYVWYESIYILPKEVHECFLIGFTEVYTLIHTYTIYLPNVVHKEPITISNSNITHYIFPLSLFLLTLPSHSHYILTNILKKKWESLLIRTRLSQTSTKFCLT